MDRDTMIALAREAGFADGVVEIVGLEGFFRFAALVAAHEREECAKVCDKQSDEDKWEGYYANQCAAAIRSRT